MARPVGERLARVLSMLPWIYREGGTTVDRAAAHFGVDRDDLLSDLVTLQCCGVPPFAYDDLVGITVMDDGEILVEPRRRFDRPLRLTPREGAMVVVAGKAMLEATDGGSVEALASALNKLEAVLPVSGVDVDLGEPAALLPLRSAVTERRRVRLTYWSQWRDVTGDRTVEPLLVHFAAGSWYLEAFDLGVGERRRFRLDRIEELEVLDDRCDRPVDREPPDDVYSGEESRLVTIDVPARAQWIVDAHRVVSVVPAGDGRIQITLPVSGERWLEVLLLRLGAEARVVAPPDLGDLGIRAAQRTLACYAG